MKPYWSNDEHGLAIYHGDCLEVLPALEQEFDLCLTDPPYGHGERWQGGTWATNPIYNKALEWDAETFDSAHLLSLIARARCAIVWGGNYFSLPVSRCWLSWEKSSRMATLADFELAWTSFDRPSKAFVAQRNPDGKREHPTQKPKALFEWCIKFAGEVATVVDPFLGSGTTLVACYRLGRRGVGIEISEEYCELAAKRLEKEMAQLRLPEPQDIPQAKQAVLPGTTTCAPEKSVVS